MDRSSQKRRQGVEKIKLRLLSHQTKRLQLKLVAPPGKKGLGRLAKTEKPDRHEIGKDGRNHQRDPTMG